METLLVIFGNLQTEIIPILPMRHGNFLLSYLIKLPKAEDSDPTYEAWKQGNTERFVALTDNSDPTYEAWKRGSIILYPF